MEETYFTIWIRLLKFGKFWICYFVMDNETYNLAQNPLRESYHMLKKYGCLIDEAASISAMIVDMLKM